MMPDNLDPNLNQEQNQQLIKSGWEKLKQDGVYEINFFGTEVNISSRGGGGDAPTKFLVGAQK